MASSLLPPQPVVYLVEPFGGSIRRQNTSMPHVFWDDAAVTRGDGIFETLLIRNGTAVNVDRHLARFRRSAQELDLPDPTGANWAAATEQAVGDYLRERVNDGDKNVEAKCVWTMTRGRASTGVPTAWLTVQPVDPAVVAQRDNGVKVLTSPRGYTLAHGVNEAPWLSLSAKTLGYAASMAALRWARSLGCDDVIYIDGDRVLEGVTSSVIVVKKDKKLRTPAPGPGVLTSTSQQALFAHAEKKGWRCKEKEVRISDLLSAESVWLVSSVRQAVRVTELDGNKLSAPGNEDEFRTLVRGALKA